MHFAMYISIHPNIFEHRRVDDNFSNTIEDTMQGVALHRAVRAVECCDDTGQIDHAQSLR